MIKQYEIDNRESNHYLYDNYMKSKGYASYTEFLEIVVEELKEQNDELRRYR